VAAWAAAAAAADSGAAAATTATTEVASGPLRHPLLFAVRRGPAGEPRRERARLERMSFQKTMLALYIIFMLVFLGESFVLVWLWRSAAPRLFARRCLVVADADDDHD
jgi:hypothetical protein